MSGDDFSKWLDAQRAELRQFHADLEKDLKRWSEPTSTSTTPQTPSSENREGRRDKGPFERFKGFVDANLSILSNFPSNVRELKARMESERLSHIEEERIISERWTGSSDSPDHITVERERATEGEKLKAKEATVKLLREAFRRNEDVSFDKIEKLYRDDEGEAKSKLGALDRFALGPLLSWGGACFYKPETDDNLPSTALWGVAGPQGHRWLSVDWFKRSPYSPILLEAQELLEDSEVEWRPAFEELLCAALDKPMDGEERVGIREPYGKAQSTYYGPGLEWMLSLQCRGILPPQIPSLYQDKTYVGRGTPQSMETGYNVFKRAMSETSVLNNLLRDGHRHSHMNGNLLKDWQALVDEIGTKSGPTTEAMPMPIRTPWRVPDTEEELYEQMLPRLGPAVSQSPPLFYSPQEQEEEVEEEVEETADPDEQSTNGTHALQDYQMQLMLLEQQNKKRQLMARKEQEEVAAANSSPPANSETTSGYQCSSQDDLLAALEKGDLGATTAILDDTYKTYGSIGDLVGEVLTEISAGHERLEVYRDSFRSITDQDRLLREAVANTDIPSTDLWRTLVEFTPQQRQQLYRGLGNSYLGRHPLSPGDIFPEKRFWKYVDEMFNEEDFLRLVDEVGEKDVRNVMQMVRGHEGLNPGFKEQILLRQQAEEQRETEATARRPDILSQLTTTQTTRLPDGTVTTKGVLKRRFADGREEVQESVQTTHEGVEQKLMVAETDKNDMKEGGGKKGGWFWS